MTDLANAALELALRACELNLLLDGRDDIRLQRQAVLDAANRVTAALEREPDEAMVERVDAILHQMATFQDGNAQPHTIALINEMADLLQDFALHAQQAREQALEDAAVAMENLCFFTDIEELRKMTKQDLSVRTCHKGAEAIRALKETKP